MSAVRPAWTEARLSSRGAASSSWSRPSVAGGVRSWTTRSCAATSVGSTPASSARKASSSPSRGSPSPQIGNMCCCESSVEPLVDLTIQMDGQLRHPQQRPAHVDQHRAAVEQDEPAGQPEIAVQPRVPEGAPIDLDGHLPPTCPPGVGSRFHFQGGRIRVRRRTPASPCRVGHPRVRTRPGQCRHGSGIGPPAPPSTVRTPAVR